MRYQVGENSHRIGLGQLRPSLPSAQSHQLSRSIASALPGVRALREIQFLYRTIR